MSIKEISLSDYMAKPLGILDLHKVIQDRVNREAELLPDYERPLWICPPVPKKQWSPKAVAAFVGHLIKSNRP